MIEPHWHVLGAGAMGCLYADALQRSGCKTTLILRKSPEKDAITLIVERDGRRSEQQLGVVTANARPVISHLLVTTKAYDVRDAVADIAHLFNTKPVVLLLVNGMGLADQLAADMPHLDIFCGSTTEGAYRIAAQHIHHAGRGATCIGRQRQVQPPQWFAQWQHAIEPCTWVSDIDAVLWAKLAVNCIINPLTAVHDCTNGQLTKSEILAAHVTALCEEVGRICHAAGYPKIAGTLAQTVSHVIAATADNRSSMLQDIHHGRRTEIDYISGYLLQVAQQHGIDAPFSRALVEDIKSRDR